MHAQTPQTHPSIRVLVADPQPLVRRGLASVAEADPHLLLVGEAADGAEVLHLTSALRPDVLVMSLRLLEVDGLDVIQRVRAARPRPEVVALVDPGRSVQAQLALRADAAACVYKCVSKDELARVIRRVHEGKGMYGAERWGRAGHDVPTLREVDVLRSVGLGRSNADIAGELGISMETVKAHLKNLFTRLGARDRTHAAVLGYHLGIISRAR
jgi:DNA-binding NarL/FixJ family response regulator